MSLRSGIEVHLASNTGEAPEVLILEIRAITPAHDLHGDEVLTCLQVLGDVELGCYLGILRVAHELAIDPDGEVASGRAYVEEHLLTFPVGRQVEGTTIGTGIVVGLTDIRGIALEGGTPGVTHVLIGLVAIAIELEESGNGEIHPLGIVVLQSEEVLRGILMVLHEVELPHALHREETG